MTTLLHWHCLTCDASGTTTGTESGADAKHVKAEGHATTASLREWAAREER